ncbi:TM0106 family RecB-like putative nuclease [Leucobacter sp. gxy201]|uniref:TM0106 family RecB-like putative nuclease n=1 Tax=Leucobacter sp. gxy201 TaxID=2957200 RepID=UPI003DA008A9
MFVQQRSEGGQRLVTSASDLTAASACEFAFLRRVDARLGRDIEVPPDDDPMLARAGRLGDAHEERTLQDYRRRFGQGSAGEPGGVVEIPRPDSMHEADLVAVAESTVRALAGRADLVFQATFFDPAQRAAGDPGSEGAGGAGELEIGFIGFADFLAHTGDGAYEVQDTKLARRAKVTALMQLAAYAEQLERIGIPVRDEAVLILGDGAHSRHRIADIAPVFRARRERLHRILLDRAAATGPDGARETAAAIAWGAPGIAACGRCEVCEPEIVRTRDPLLIAGIRAAQRDALVAAGVGTIDRVAELARLVPGDGGPEIAGITAQALARLARQAAAQIGAVPGEAPPFRVTDPAPLAAIPAPDDGDIFFDFEGDPMYREPGPDGSARWGIDYLFGWVDRAGEFSALWAHDLVAEREALIAFIAYVAARRRAHPGMRIYHYAAYERTHLLSLAARHGVCEAEVDELLREHVLVDLYPIARRALTVGSRSYSIKKLEPLYMGAELRDEAGVTNAAQSVTEYAEAVEQLASDDPAARAAGQRRLDDIADYNRYDCVSTLRLRDWLLGLADEHGIAPFPAASADDAAQPPLELSPVAARLAVHADAWGPGPERSAIALAGSAIDYHQREQKSFWWEHFARLVDPIDDWADTRDVLVVDSARSRVGEDWFVPPRARAERRRLELRGALAPGSGLRAGSDAFLLYEHPAPFPQPGAAPGARGAKQVKIIDGAPAPSDAGSGDDARETLVIVEEMIGGAAQYRELPVALVPGPPPRAGAQKGAIEEWGAHLSEALDRGEFPRDPVVDLVLRETPRVRAGAGAGLVRPESEEALAAGGGDPEARTIGAVVESLRRLDRSTLAVQGPPGTGKTYLAAHVIARLVADHGWRIGVVAQSHRVVENVLDAVVGTGLAPGLVGKVPQGGRLSDDDPRPPYTVLQPNRHRAFAEGHRDAGRGCVIGGTAWDFSNETRFGRRSLDLLVVDEAGQFSLAPTIAASVAAERLLLLGDPQQLPQVSQGSHPEPVDSSALGWLLGAHETMPAELGYFLAETRRMRPELAGIVSELAYDGRLHAHPAASQREAVGVGAAGLHWHPVRHSGNATASNEEASAVARIAHDMLRGALRARGAPERRLDERDVIVVAAYNAQVGLIAEALAEAGLPGVRVGTVDKFQGQEAVIAIVSLAASSADDIPRGVEFLLMRNRLNVAISRAQWAAHLVSSTRLGDGLPSSAEGVAALSGYLRLLERAERAEPAEQAVSAG